MLRLATIGLLLLLSLSGCRTIFRKDPKLLTQDYGHLIYIRDNIRKNSPIYMPAYQRLCKEAEYLINDYSDVRYASMGFPEQKGYTESLINKEQMKGAVSNTDLGTRSPYIFNDRGGENANGSLGKKLDQMADNVTTLSMAWFYTGQEKFAEEATRIICEWFLEMDQDSGPLHLQSRISRVLFDSCNISIFDSRRYIEVLDAIYLISSSKAWNPIKMRQLKKWFSNYLAWLLTSEKGKTAGEFQNHVGTWYKAMLASVGFFINDKDFVREVINDVMNNRLNIQIDASGMQPMETGSSGSFNNSLSNLEAHFILAKIGEWNQLDYWHHDADGKGNIKKAADYLFRYIGNMEDWPYEQVSEIDVRSMFRLILKSINIYHDPQYNEFFKKLFPELSSNDRLLISVHMDH